MTSHGGIDVAATLYSRVETLLQTWTVVNTAVLVLTVVALVTYIWITRLWPASFERMRDESCPLPLPPGTMGCPFIGETLEFARKGSDFYASRLDGYGKVYKTHILGSPFVRVIGGENVRHVLTADHDTIRSNLPRSVQRLMGPNSLLSSTGDEHRKLKRVMTSLFTPTVLASFVPQIQAIVDRHLDGWCQTCEDEGQILSFPACQQLTLDLSSEMVLGSSTQSQGQSSLHAAMRDFIANLFCLPAAIPGLGMWKGLRARERLLQEVRRKLSNKDLRSEVDFLSIVELMQRCPELTDRPHSIEDNALELFFASYSTTSSALCDALLCLGRDPEILQRVEAELEEEGLLDDHSVELTYEMIGRLHYVKCFNREVLRLYPPAGAAFRKTAKTFEVGGFQIPKEWTVAYSIRETQQTSPVFPDPERFLPERWLSLDTDPELKEKLRFHYIPFGMGVRVCLGRRLAELVQAAFLVEVVRRCRFRLHNPDPVMKYLPVAKPADDLPATFCPRRQGEAAFSNSC